MKFKISSKLFLIIIVLNSISFSLNAQENCMDIIKSMLTKLDEQVVKEINIDDHLNHRNFLIKFAKKNDIPVFIKQNDQGVEVPIILLNSKTAKKLDSFLENSFGTQVALQKDWNNDHGLLRAGKNIIDLDSPGARGYGELHQTGLAWKDVHGYLAHRGYGSSPILEVSYLLTPTEKNIIDYYQKVRRAAIFRVQFTFGGHNGPDYPNLLKSGGEHCFIFCKASAVQSHLSEIKSKLTSYGLKDPDSVLENPNFKILMKKLQDEVNKTDAGKVNPNMLSGANTLTNFNSFYPEGLAANKKKEFIDWLVAYDSSKKYMSVMRDLGVSGDYGLRDAINKRASAIFVIDEAASIESFKQGTYTNSGKFTNWPNGKQYPAE